VTNLGIDHLDYHQSLAEYIEAKTGIVRYQNEIDFAVLNQNSTFSGQLLGQIKSKIKYFSKADEDADVIVRNNGSIGVVIVRTVFDEDFVVCTSDEIRLVGRHNLENIAAAALATGLFGVSKKAIREGVLEFQGLPYRLELVDEIKGVRFINDSFATNPGPTIAAILSFTEDKILILGGSEKGADFREMAEIISQNKVKAVVLIGTEGPRIRMALEGAGFEGKIVFGGSDMDEILKKAAMHADPGDIVILSPACASFDMFKNYKDRGEKFNNAISKLKIQKDI